MQDAVFSALTSVTGGITFAAQSTMVSLDGFNALQTVTGGALAISSNTALKSIK